MVHLADSRRLVDVEADAMAGAMEEALAAAVDHAGRVAAALHHRRHLPMDGRSRGPVPDQLDAAELGGEHGIVG